MKRRLLVAALIYTGLALVSMMLVMLYLIWTPGAYDGENMQGRVLQTWAVFGVVPTFVLWIVWSYPGWKDD